MTGFTHPPTDLFRRGLPLATALAAILLDVMPLRSAAPVTVAPAITLIVIFYWSTQRPDLLGMLPVFVVTLVFDAIAGLPLGLTSLSILVAYGVLWPRRQLIKGHGFLVVWACFMLACIVVLGLRWLIACLWWGTLFGLEPLMFEIFLTVIFYPPVTWALAHCQSLLSRVPLASGS